MSYDFEDPDNLRDAEIARQMEEDIIKALEGWPVLAGQAWDRSLRLSEREEIAKRIVQHRPGAGFWAQKVKSVRELLLQRLGMYQDARQAGSIPSAVPALIPIEEVLTLLDAIEDEEKK